MSKDSFDLWRVVCMRRTELSYWDIIPPPGVRRNGNCNLRIFWEVAPRDVDRALWRRRGANITAISEGPRPLTLAGGTALQVQSDDEMEPDLTPDDKMAD